MLKQALHPAHCRCALCTPRHPGEAGLTARSRAIAAVLIAALITRAAFLILF